jgi:hypothetical protein
VGNRSIQNGGGREGLVLRAMIARTTPRPVDIARAGGFSRQYVNRVLTGRARASARFIEACRSLEIPVDLIWGAAGGPELREPGFDRAQGSRDNNDRDQL